MNKEKLLELCNQIQEEIDWEFDLCSGYQEMITRISELINEITEGIKS
jgi:hypothetical protein